MAVDMLPRTDTGKWRTSYFLVPCGDGCTAFLQKSDSVISVRVEFGEGEDNVPLDNIAKRAVAYKSNYIQND